MALSEGGAVSGLDSTWSEVAQIHAARLGSKDIKMCRELLFETGLESGWKENFKIHLRFFF